MKKSLLVLLGIVFSTAAFCQTSAKSPIMSFDEKTFNFGDVKQGQKVSHIFHYKNIGTDTLRIDNIVSSCGCTVPNSYERKVAPGASGSITVEFNSENKMGVVNKTLTILSNAAPSGADPAEFLNIRVNVIP